MGMLIFRWPTRLPRDSSYSHPILRVSPSFVIFERFLPTFPWNTVRPRNFNRLQLGTELWHCCGRGGRGAPGHRRRHGGWFMCVKYYSYPFMYIYIYVNICIDIYLSYLSIYLSFYSILFYSILFYSILFYSIYLSIYLSIYICIYTYTLCVYSVYNKVLSKNDDSNDY